MELKIFKQGYNLLGNDKTRALVLQGMEFFHIRKDIVRMDTNDLCNIECIFCSNKPQKLITRRVMSLDNFKILIDKVRRTTRMLYLSCSYEPLMTPGFGSYISYARSKGIPFISFATNGLLLHKNNLIKQLVDEQIHEVIISFNGFNQQDYNRIMFRSNFDQVMNNLQNIKEYKEKKGSAFPKIRLNTILIKSNLLNFAKIAEFILHYNIDAVQYRPLLTWDLAETDTAGRVKMNTLEQPQNNPGEVSRERIANLSGQELKEILKEINKYSSQLAQLGKRIILPADLLNNNQLIDRDKRLSVKTSCCIPFFCYWINYTGTVSVCCSDADSIIGNIFTDSLEEIIIKRDVFRKKALAGKCRMNCLSNAVDSSTII